MHPHTVWVVALHLLVTLVHGAAHAELGIGLPPWKQVYVFVVILAGPLVALALLWRGRARAGRALLFTTMAGALFFGVHHHFVVQSPDHVAHVAAGTWGTVFTVSAVLLALTEGAGCAVAFTRR